MRQFKKPLRIIKFKHNPIVLNKIMFLACLKSSEAKQCVEIDDNTICIPNYGKILKAVSQHNNIIESGNLTKKEKQAVGIA